MTVRPQAWWLACLLACGCATESEVYQRHLERELRFFQAGVDIERETRRVIDSLEGAGMSVVDEIRGAGFRAIGAANLRFRRSAVRIITRRGVSAAEDASRDDLLQPGRVHLLTGFSPQLENITVVGWVRIEASATAGCARLRRIDPGGYVRPVHADVSSFGDAACLSGWSRRRGKLWGAVAWPALSAYETPTLQIPLELETRRLDDPRPPGKLVQRAAEGWIDAAREARVDELSTRVGFWERHAPALELAALGLLEGASAAAQRVTYLQQAGPPESAAERALRSETVARIERGWLSAEAAAAVQEAESETQSGAPAETDETPAPAEGAAPSRSPADTPVETEPETERPVQDEPDASDVLQEPVHGQEAQKEEG